MRYLTIIIVLAALSIGGCQRTTAQKLDTVFYDDGWDIEEPYVENGRTVLYRHTGFYDGDTHTMTYYILPSTDPSFEEHVAKLYGDPKLPAAWTQGEYDTLFYEAGSPYIHVDTKGLPSELFQVKRYRGKYYLTADYRASIRITDSALITHSMEDWVEQLCGVEKHPDGTYTLQLCGWNYEKRAVDTYEITFPKFDEENLIYDLGDYWKFTTREHLKDFDLIDIDNWFELFDPLTYDK